jgi:hypothetical protein
MKLDARDYPVGHLLTEVAAEQLGIYVHVAQFNHDSAMRTFRMIVDADISREAISSLLTSSVRDRQGVYTFSHIEAISGPVVDQGPRTGSIVNYLRITFM